MYFSYFSVIGPQTIRAEKDYLCAVSSHNQDYDLYLEVGILWDTNVLVKQVFVPRGQTKMVVFPVSSLCFFLQLFTRNLFGISGLNGMCFLYLSC